MVFKEQEINVNTTKIKSGSSENAVCNRCKANFKRLKQFRE
jgi:hypothetical protein